MDCEIELNMTLYIYMYIIYIYIATHLLQQSLFDSNGSIASFSPTEAQGICMAKAWQCGQPNVINLAFGDGSNI